MHFLFEGSCRAGIAAGEPVPHILGLVQAIFGSAQCIQADLTVVADVVIGRHQAVQAIGNANLVCQLGGLLNTGDKKQGIPQQPFRDTRRALTQTTQLQVNTGK